MSKNIFVSWTFWFGLAQILSAVFGYMSGAMDSNMALTLFGTGIGSIGLRIKTTQPVHFGEADPTV